MLLVLLLLLLPLTVLAFAVDASVFAFCCCCHLVWIDMVVAWTAVASVDTAATSFVVRLVLIINDTDLSMINTVPDHSIHLSTHLLPFGSLYIACRKKKR